MKEEIWRAGREGRLTTKPTLGLARPDTIRLDKTRHENYQEYNAEPMSNYSDQVFKDSRGNEDKLTDRLRKFELTVSLNQLVA